MILSCQGISKSFGEKVILEDASFHIEEREKAALIGNNGAGKTTLLRIIMNELHADAGQVVLAKDKRIGYLAQYQDVQGHLSVYEELLSTKQYIIDMEDRLRAMEVQMKNASGEELDRLMTAGKDKGSIKSKITESVKEEYLAGSDRDREKLEKKLLALEDAEGKPLYEEKNFAQWVSVADKKAEKAKDEKNWWEGVK